MENPFCKHRPRRVEMREQGPESYHRPVGRGVYRDGRPTPCGRTTKHIAWIPLRTSLRKRKEKPFNPCRRIRDLPGSAQQVQIHRNDFAGGAPTKNHPKAGDGKV
ncbi:MAG: hypothetical protein NVS4B2_15410 [Chloroflexota bacterium]